MSERDINIFYPEEVGRICGVSAEILREWAKIGRLVPKKDDLKGCEVYNRDKLEKFLKRPKDSLLPHPTKDELIIGARMCFSNAERLLQDSRKLLENGSCPTAYSICIIALEELSKALSFLDPLSKSRRETFSWESFWSDFFSHYQKLRRIELYMRIMAVLSGENVDKLFEDSLLPIITDAQKQNGFYVDYIKAPSGLHFESPESMVTEKEAKNIIALTQRVVEGINKQESFSDKAVNDLWSKSEEEILREARPSDLGRLIEIFKEIHEKMQSD